MMKGSNKILVGLIAIAVVAVAVTLLVLVNMFKSSSIALDVDETIENTPVSVERMRQIGEWEFLSISDEEIVDTVKKKLLGKEELVRIYYGELRLGVDMKDLADDAITIEGDTVSIALPKIKLLDENFIDEARTKAFYETGKWSGKDHEALYEKAKRQMKAHCLTKENTEKAQANAKVQMQQMLKALGVEKVKFR